MKKLFRYGYILCACIFAISILIFIFDYMNLFSRWGFSVNELNLSFWTLYATLLGGFISGALTLVGVIVTINENRKEQREEATRLVMPMLKIFPAEYDYKWHYIQFDANLTEESRLRPRKDIPDTAHITFEIKNIGTRELLDFHLCNISSTFFDDNGYHHSLFPIIYSGESYYLNFNFYEKGIYDQDSAEDKFHTLISPISFNCYYKDCLGNWYIQELSISVCHSVTEKTPADQRALNISIERTQILSAPRQIKESDLPWIQEPDKICIH